MRRLTLGLVILMLAITGAACGGGDDDGGGGTGGEFPVVSGAKRIDSRDMKDSEAADLGFKVDNAKIAAFKSNKSVDEVRSYYSDGIKSDGWDVQNNIDITTYSLTVLSHDKDVLLVTVVKGSDAKADSSLLGQTEDFSLDEGDFGDDDALILLVRFTCQEDDLAACTGA